MVLNDVFDIEQDRAERPQRPLPSGRISYAFARSLGFGMLLVGLLSGVIAGLLPSSEPVLTWRPGAVAGLLALCIVGYDAWLKRTPWGPVAMGGCRFLNVLLGMSVAMAADTPWPLGGFAWHELLVAGGIGVYVAGITWFARHEAGESHPAQLVPAAVVMMAGIGLLGMLHRHLPATIVPTLRGEAYWWLLLGLLAFTILRRLSMAIMDPSPRQVQWAVKHSILSLIMLDAAVAVEVSHWSYGLGIVALLVPSFALGFWVYST
jgi:4-hydroxybenzoate polyprenyltransferase